jgi:hypothetical protein
MTVHLTAVISRLGDCLVTHYKALDVVSLFGYLSRAVMSSQMPLTEDRPRPPKE